MDGLSLLTSHSCAAFKIGPNLVNKVDPLLPPDFLLTNTTIGFRSLAMISAAMGANFRSMRSSCDIKLLAASRNPRARLPGSDVNEVNNFVRLTIDVMIPNLKSFWYTSNSLFNILTNLVATQSVNPCLLVLSLLSAPVVLKSLAS